MSVNDSFDSPPRKRRAAAVAAQKNWQLIEEEDDGVIAEDDIIIINEHKSLPKVNKTKTNNITISPQNATNSLSTLKKISIPQTIIIDMSQNKRKAFADTLVDNDDDYSPYQDLTHKTVNKYKKTTTTPTPYRKPINTNIQNNINSNNITNNVTNTRNRNNITISSSNNNINNSNTYSNNNRNQTSIPNNCAEIICIDSEEKRIIKRSAQSVTYRKPPVIKLHANEPQVFPIVDENVEEIIGTYIEDEEDYDFVKSDELTDNLEMDVFHISPNDIENSVELIDDSDVFKSSGTSLQIIQPNKPLICFNKKEKQRNFKNCYFDEVIGTLQMECENFDDEFTDEICFDCEDDILNSQQWSESINSKKEYDNYAKAVRSTKAVKFVPESEVKDAVGIVTTTVSETTRTVKIATKPAAKTRAQQNVHLSQALSRPIPSVSSTLNRINLLSPQTRPPMMTPMPIPNAAMNGTHLLLPVSNASGLPTPLIFAPNSQNMLASNMGSLPPGVQVILSQGPQNQTFIMYPKTNANSIPPNSLLNTNVVNPLTMASNIYLSNQTNNYMPQNIITSNTPNAGLRLRSQTQPTTRLRGPTPALVHMQTLRAPNSVGRPPTPLVRTSTPTPRLPSANNYTLNVRNQNSYGNQTIPRNVTLNTNNSKVPENTAASDPLYDCLTVIKGNPSKKVNMRTLLTIKPLPFSWPSNIDALISSLIKLDNALMKEKFKESPIAWMVSAQLICPPKCNVCHKGLCNQVTRSRDGHNEFWMCNNSRCNSSFVIDRPQIFSGPQFDIPVSKLLFIIYYWSIQVDVEDLIKTGQIEMGQNIIYNIWQKLQKVCALALLTKDSRLGSVCKTVDIASVQIGRFYVIGAMESGSHRCKLGVVSLSNLVQQSGKEFILQPILKWIEKGTNIKTCERKFLPLREMGYRITLVNKSEFVGSGKNLSLTNIGGYLVHHLQRLFKDLDVSTLTYEILSNVLEELLWRERYGTNPYSAFYNIIKHIAEQCGIRKPEQLAPNIKLPVVQQNRSLNTTPVRSSNSTPVRPAGRPANVVRDQQTVDPNSIYVDEYYYSSLKLKSSYAKKNSQEVDSTKDSIQCHLCQMFFDNILIIKHLLEHLEKERRGRVRKGDNNEPECKHCLRFFSNRTLHMHEELANMKLIPYSCRICSLPFYARNPFIQHMKTSHFSGEMPYYCDICSFRSSFQKNLLDHFETEHLNTDSVMCPFCLRIFILSKYKNLSQFVYRHLTTHYAVASVYDCDKCVLTFTAKTDLREHCFKGHNPSNAIDEKFEIMPYVVQPEEIALCVRAQEKELFTPNLPTFGQMEYLGITEPMNTSDTNEVDSSLLVNCDPFATDFTFEPEVEIRITDTNQSVADFILPVDSDYSNEQLQKMLVQSFEISKELIDSQHVILSNNQLQTCYECKTYVDISHYMKKGICAKCSYVSHCKKAFTEHMIKVHSNANENNSTKYFTPSVLRSFPPLDSYHMVCQDCEYKTTDGNKMALHMIEWNHLSPLCKLMSRSTPLLITN